MLEEILEFLILGLVLGGIYALFAVGLTLIFGVLDIVNVAHGEFFAIGGYALYVAMVVLGLLAGGRPRAGHGRRSLCWDSWSIRC